MVKENKYILLICAIVVASIFTFNRINRSERSESLRPFETMDCPECYDLTLDSTYMRELWADTIELPELDTLSIIESRKDGLFVKQWISGN